jgi:hypothetical protein
MIERADGLGKKEKGSPGELWAPALPFLLLFF